MTNGNGLELKGTKVVLESLNESHKNGLYQAAQDQSIWTYNGSKAFGDQFYDWFAKALAEFKNQQQILFVVRQLSDHRILGSTRFYDINRDHCRLAIGYTWYIPEVWGTVVNPECKYLLLNYAFDDLKMNRIEFITDFRNARSRAAITKLGAAEEGKLRQHMVLEGGVLRDSMLYSIIRPEWPAVKAKLEERIAAFEEQGDS